MMKTGDRNGRGSAAQESRDALGSLAAMQKEALVSHIFPNKYLTYMRVGKSQTLITLPAKVWNWVSKLMCMCMCILTYIHAMILGL